jgi:hypothetical protein
MATKKQIVRWCDTLAKRQAGIAAERDKLDEAIEEMQSLRESCERAWDDIQGARDALSELV